jgi:DNA-binding response OmpR family regulator
MLDSGVNDVLAKPFSMDQLGKKIETFRTARTQQKAA